MFGDLDNDFIAIFLIINIVDHTLMWCMDLSFKFVKPYIHSVYYLQAS